MANVQLMETQHSSHPKQEGSPPPVSGPQASVFTSLSFFILAQREHPSSPRKLTLHCILYRSRPLPVFCSSCMFAIPFACSTSVASSDPPTSQQHMHLSALRETRRSAPRTLPVRLLLPQTSTRDLTSLSPAFAKVLFLLTGSCYLVSIPLSPCHMTGNPRHFTGHSGHLVCAAGVPPVEERFIERFTKYSVSTFLLFPVLFFSYVTIYYVVPSFKFFWNHFPYRKPQLSG